MAAHQPQWVELIGNASRKKIFKQGQARPSGLSRQPALAEAVRLRVIHLLCLGSSSIWLSSPVRGTAAHLTTPLSAILNDFFIDVYW